MSSFFADGKRRKVSLTYRAREISIAFIFLALVSLARADWTVREVRSEFSPDRVVEHRQVRAESETGASADVELALFSTKKGALRVIDNPDGADDLARAMQREKAIAGVNGGYFDPNDAPVGLSISAGQVIAPLRKARLLSGVISEVDGRVRIQRTAEFSMKSKPTAARQCGPILLEHGKASAGLNATRVARRTFCATFSDAHAALGYCSAVTLAQLAEILAALDPKVERALNMDGGSSSAFWFEGADGIFAIGEQKTVRDFLAIVPQKPRP